LIGFWIFLGIKSSSATIAASWSIPAAAVVQSQRKSNSREIPPLCFEINREGGGTKVTRDCALAFDIVKCEASNALTAKKKPV